MTAATGKRQKNERTEPRASILASLDTKTKVMGLVALVMEAAFLGSLGFLPQEQRLYALLTCAGILAITLIGMFVVEISETKSRRSAEEASPLKLPKEIEGSAIYIDRRGWNAPGQAAACYRTASTFKFVGRYQDALDFYYKVVSIEPEHWKARYNIGSCLLYEGKLADAEEKFRSLSEELRRKDWQQDELLTEILHGCFIQLNKICDSQQRYEDGESYLRQSLDVKPDDPLSYANFVIAAKKSGKDQEAAKWYRSLMEHPDKLEVLCTITGNEKAILDSLVGPRTT